LIAAASRRACTDFEGILAFLDGSYHSRMDPTIDGALIGGGFALVGFAASMWATALTLRANRTMASDQRLWERGSRNGLGLATRQCGIPDLHERDDDVR
jgi:hypothetical protein